MLLESNFCIQCGYHGDEPNRNSNSDQIVSLRLKTFYKNPMLWFSGASKSAPYELGVCDIDKK